MNNAEVQSAVDRFDHASERTSGRPIASLLDMSLKEARELAKGGSHGDWQEARKNRCSSGDFVCKQKYAT